MTMLAIWVAVLAATAMQAPAKTTLQRPTDWVTRTDQGTDVSAPLYFVTMPPGWHITTGPGTILYNPRQTCEGSCRIEAEIYLFPGKGDGGYGVFLSGFELGEQEAGPNYEVFMLRWDGAHTRGNWIKGIRMPAAAFRPEMSQFVEKGLPAKPVKNVITIEIDKEENGDYVGQFFVNGNRLYREHHLARSFGRQPYLGTVGLRVDAGVNLHVTRLDVVAK
jgi:hypothetical protein